MIGCASVLFCIRTVAKKYRSKSLNLLTVWVSVLGYPSVCLWKLGFSDTSFPSMDLAFH